MPMNLLMACGLAYVIALVAGWGMVTHDIGDAQSNWRNVIIATAVWFFVSLFIAGVIFVFLLRYNGMRFKLESMHNLRETYEYEVGQIEDDLVLDLKEPEPKKIEPVKKPTPKIEKPKRAPKAQTMVAPKEADDALMARAEALVAAAAGPIQESREPEIDLDSEMAERD